MEEFVPDCPDIEYTGFLGDLLLFDGLGSNVVMIFLLLEQNRLPNSNLNVTLLIKPNSNLVRPMQRELPHPHLIAHLLRKFDHQQHKDTLVAGLAHSELFEGAPGIHHNVGDCVGF